MHLATSPLLGLVAGLAERAPASDVPPDLAAVLNTAICGMHTTHDKWRTRRTRRTAHEAHETHDTRPDRYAQGAIRVQAHRPLVRAFECLWWEQIEAHIRRWSRPSLPRAAAAHHHHGSSRWCGTPMTRATRPTWIPGVPLHGPCQLGRRVFLDFNVHNLNASRNSSSPLHAFEASDRVRHAEDGWEEVSLREQGVFEPRCTAKLLKFSRNQNCVSLEEFHKKQKTKTKRKMEQPAGHATKRRRLVPATTTGTAPRGHHRQPPLLTPSPSGLVGFLSSSEGGTIVRTALPPPPRRGVHSSSSG